MAARIRVLRGDITQQSVDAIVNAANTGLCGGGGVDGAIHTAAGPQLLKACLALEGCETGQAKITGGYQLPARYVIHTPGPIWRGGGHHEDALLASCYRACLTHAAAVDAQTLAFPSISTGAYRFPLGRAAVIAVREVVAGLRAHPGIVEVQFICFSEPVRQAYQAALDATG